MSDIRYEGRTDVGLVRENNEDAFVVNRFEGSPWLLCAAIDGVGGYEGGEVAASLTAETLVSYVGGHLGDKPLDVVKQAVVEANNVICAAKAEKDDLARMGCVASVALVDVGQRTAFVAHVGDSRIYLYGPGGLRKITHDHSLVGYMEDNGDITEFQAMHHPQRNEIDRCIGDVIRSVDQDDFLESGIYPIPEEGKILLCSDGLSDLVPSRVIAGILSRPDSTSEKVDALVEEAKERGGKDNITVVLVEFPPKPEDVANLPANEEPAVEEEPATEEPGASTEGRPARCRAGWLAVFLAIGLLAGFCLGRISKRTDPAPCPCPAGCFCPDTADHRAPLDSAQKDTVLTDTLAVPENTLTTMTL